MKHVKLFEGFLSEKKKKEDEEDPGTELSNTTGIITAMEVTEATPHQPKYGTDDEFSNRVSDWAMDIMSMDDRTEAPTTVVELSIFLNLINAAGEKFAKAVGFKYIPAKDFKTLIKLINNDEFGDTFDVYDKEAFLTYYKDYFTK